MEFFNIDLHVSVIEDMRTHFEVLGHTVDSHLLSGHHWTIGRPRADQGDGAPGSQARVGYGDVNLDTWEGFFQGDARSVRQRIERWQTAHPELREYAGYLVTYPPSFALLYEGLPGHTIVNIPIRYEHQFTNDPERWHAFNAFLAHGIDEGRITVVANNLYDAAYFEYFVGRNALRISSICNYVDRHTMRWNPTGDRLLAFGENAGCREAVRHVPELLFVRDVLPTYTYPEIVKAKGIVWIPYTSSVMSFFEHYWLCIPLFVPTQRFLMQMWRDGKALSTLSWHPKLLAGSNVPRHDRWLNERLAFSPKHAELPDPHTLQGLFGWMDLYDFYNEAEFPHVQQFSSWDDLREQIRTLDFVATSKKMREHNLLRLQYARSAWRDVLSKIHGGRTP